MHQHDGCREFFDTNESYGSLQPDLGKYPTPPKVPLHIDKPEVIPRIPKGVLKCLGNNPNSRATQHYSIVKDLGETPYMMSALEVLQNFHL